jgi:glycosyltransferase involved in cell wall biosynthesis
MKILWNVRLYPPSSNCGAEWYAHEVNKHLIGQGHEVTVMLPKCTTYEFQGVKVKEYSQSLYHSADVVFTHLELTDKTILDCKRFNKPLFFVAHNTFDYPLVRMNKQVNVILNSEASVDICGYDRENRLVFRPPVDIDYYKVSRGNAEYVTLINLNENKGAKLFYEIADLMPNKKFLGVLGSYNRQLVIDRPNVTILPNTPDIRPVYQMTKILLMPSRYESWGRTATEAMASGIPVICHPTFGLKENCGSAGVYVGREKPYLWVEKINEVLSNYQTYSDACMLRAEELRPNFAEFDLFLNRILQL